jgi:hypothetical protein
MPYKLKSLQDKSKLHAIFCKITGYRIPTSYFLSADCYGVKQDEDGEFVGGFVLKKGHLFDLRSFHEIPLTVVPSLPYTKYMNTTADLTGYFLRDKRYGLKLTWFFVKTIVFYNSKYFIYSYDVSNTGLGKYYASGDPTLLYSGIPALIEGYTEEQAPVNVEILSKWGIVKIFLHRTRKMFLKF